MAAAKKKTTLKTKTVKGTTPSSSKNEEKEEEDLSKLTVKQLKSLLEKKKLPTDGLKKDLIARLKNVIRSSSLKGNEEEEAAKTTTTKEKTTNKRGKSEEAPTHVVVVREEEEDEKKTKKPRLLSSPPEKEKTGGGETGEKTKEEKKPIPILPPNTTSADKKAAKNDLDDVRKTYETTMKRGACEDKVVEELIDEGFLERSVWPQILASTSKSEHPDENTALAFAKCIVHKARNMNVPDAFATLSNSSSGSGSGSGDGGNEEGENALALKMLVETLTNVAFENVTKSSPEVAVEMTTVVRFLNVLMNALENDMARKSALPLVSIQIWKAREEKRLEMELDSAPVDVQKKWQKLMRKEAKQEPTRMQSRRNSWLTNLTTVFLDTLPVARASENAMAFCAYYLEFIVDLLSQLPTRRFVRAILGDANIFVKANLTINEMRSDEEGADGNVNLLKQLLEMAKDFYDFEVDDHTGDALSAEEMESRR